MPYIIDEPGITRYTAPEAETLKNEIVEAYNKARWRGGCNRCPFLFYSDNEDALAEELLDHFINTHRIIVDMETVEK